MSICCVCPRCCWQVSAEVVAALQAPEGHEGALEPELAAGCAGMAVPFLLALVNLPDYVVQMCVHVEGAEAVAANRGGAAGSSSSSAAAAVPATPAEGALPNCGATPSSPKHACAAQLVRLFSLAMPQLLSLYRQLSQGAGAWGSAPGSAFGSFRFVVWVAPRLVDQLERLAATALVHAAARRDHVGELSWRPYAWSGGAEFPGNVAGEELDGDEEALAALLLAPCYGGRVLAVCSNPRCGSFEGGSEAGRPLKRCGGRCGGAVAYCCAGCQRAHWAAGHREECGRCGTRGQ